MKGEGEGETLNRGKDERERETSVRQTVHTVCLTSLTTSRNDGIGG